MEYIKSGVIALRGIANSMQGGRPENQDDMEFVDTPLGFLAIVCDGMGGGPGGKIASYIAKYEIVQALNECSQQTTREYALKLAVSRAHESIEKKMKEMPSLQGMGSTMVAVLINEDSAIIAHVGDSRFYLLRRGKCVYRSKDHSLVGELVRKKVMTEEEARLSPQSNVITRGLGSTSNNIPDIEEISYQKGDRVILCTDGVWGSMSHKELIKRLKQKIQLDQLVSNLSTEIDQVGNTNGGFHDNHTLVILDIEQDSTLKINKERKSIMLICLSIGIISAIVCIVLLLYSHENKHKELPLNVYYSNHSIENNTINTSAISGFNTKFNNIDTINKVSDSMYEESSRHQKDSTFVYNKRAETIQKIINRYTIVQVAETKDIIKFQNIIRVQRKDIVSLYKELKLLYINDENLPTINTLTLRVENDSLWYIEKINDRKFILTIKSKELIEEQKIKLKNIKENK